MARHQKIKSKWKTGRKNSESEEKKKHEKKKTTDQVNWPLGDSFIPSMKSRNGIFWMVHWWVLGHSGPQKRASSLVFRDSQAPCKPRSRDRYYSLGTWPRVVRFARASPYPTTSCCCVLGSSHYCHLWCACANLMQKSWGTRENFGVGFFASEIISILPHVPWEQMLRQHLLTMAMMVYHCQTGSLPILWGRFLLSECFWKIF